MAATLWLPGSLVSHRAAASLHGLRGFERAPLELVVERGGRRSGHPSLILHETSDLRGIDRSERAGIPTTSRVRTLIDLPAAAPPARCRDARDDALRRDPSLLGLVAQRHAQLARPGRSGIRVLRTMLRDRGAAPALVDSGFERRMLDLIRAAGLPEPKTQHPVRLPDTTCYLDVAWPQLRVGVECDSLAHHLNERAFRWERRRRRALTLLGWDLLEFTYDEVIGDPGAVATQIARALDLAGRRAAG
jgi:very-short-patch-repair endonuclease